MADIGVFHNSLAAGGGAEAVGAHALETLLGDGHDVTLYTDGPVDVEGLNAYHGTRLHRAALRVHRLDGRSLEIGRRCLDAASTLGGVEDLPLLRNALADRAVRRHASDHDLVLSTQGEFFAPRAVQYVHFPYYSERAMRTYGTRFDERLYPTYHRLCRAVKPLAEPPAATLTNSAWTADVIEEAYGLDATVLYPPVRTEEFDPPPWADREDGFVAVGRIHHLKRQATLVEILDRLRERDVETHLHLVGPVGTGEYAERVRQLAAARPYVTLEGRVSRDRLVELLETHRYGLHGRRFEHFGIAVAEMVAAGMVPFVPDSGGQVEVVGSSELTYGSVAEAVECITRVLETVDSDAPVRAAVSASEYGTARFATELRKLIDDAEPRRANRHG